MWLKTISYKLCDSESLSPKQIQCHLSIYKTSSKHFIYCTYAYDTGFFCDFHIICANVSKNVNVNIEKFAKINMKLVSNYRNFPHGKGDFV